MTLSPRWLALAALLVAQVPPFLFGALYPGYSHISQYISELGQTGAPQAALVNLGSFVPAGVLVALTCAALTSRLPPTAAARLGLGLLSLVGVSWLVAAFAPCDVGCPADGSARQAVHNLAGAVGYIGGGVGLIVIGQAQRRAGASARRVLLTSACGAILVFGLVAMAAPELAPVRGLVQRSIEWTAFGWMVATAWTRQPGASVA